MLEHQIQYLIKELEEDQIDSEHAFQLTGIKARQLVKLLNYCPKVENLRELVQHALEFISKEFLEWELIHNLKKYAFALANFSRVNPAWEAYDPRKKTAKKPPEAKDRPEQNSPYRRLKPVGRNGHGDSRSQEEQKTAILQLVRYYEQETQQPAHWEEVVQQLAISRSSGFRRVTELIADGLLKEVPQKKDATSKPLFLKPKYLTTDNHLGIRGRPRKLVVTNKFPLASLDQRTCGKCCHFHVRRCGVITDLIQMEMPEYIPYREIWKLIHNQRLTNLNISPRLLGCRYFRKRKRDYWRKSLKVHPITEFYVEDGTTMDLEEYVCAECGHGIDYTPHPRTIKCPSCNTKYTWKRVGSRTMIKVNVDYNHTRNEVVRSICGISKENLPEPEALDADISTRTKHYRTRVTRKRQKQRREHPLVTLGTIFPFLFLFLKIDFPLRQNLSQRYGTPAFYSKRLRDILMSYTLATREFKTLRQYEVFQDIEDWKIEAHVFVQIEQMRQLFQPTEENPDTPRIPTLAQFQTAERLIAKQCWQVTKLFLDKIAFYISNRKLLRYVNEFLEQPFRGSKGYTPANTLINCTHKLCYEATRKLLLDHGYGWECPGAAEHTHSKIGVVLDLADPLKIAYRIALIKAVVEGIITEDDFYSVEGRHHREIYHMKVTSVQKLERIMKRVNQKHIFPVATLIGDAEGGSIPLWEAFEQSVEQLTHDLKYSDELNSTFVYAPIKEDYRFVVNILKNYDIHFQNIPQTS